MAGTHRASGQVENILAHPTPSCRRNRVAQQVGLWTANLCALLRLAWTPTTGQPGSASRKQLSDESGWEAQVTCDGKGTALSRPSLTSGDNRPDRLPVQGVPLANERVRVMCSGLPSRKTRYLLISQHCPALITEWDGPRGGGGLIF